MKSVPKASTNNAIVVKKLPPRSSTTEITENNINTEKEFKRSFSYQTKSNKFELKNYENTIQDNLTNKIILREVDKNSYEENLAMPLGCHTGPKS